MHIHRIRRATISFLALLVLGSCTASVAAGEAGPFWHHRQTSAEGAGSKIEAKSPEALPPEAGAVQQTLKMVIAGTPVEVVAANAQAKGIIYNNSMQGQIKLLAIYVEPKLDKPELKSCVPTLGEGDQVKLIGHLAWKWNGLKSQLEEATQKGQVADVIFTPTEIENGATGLPTGEFTKVTLEGSGCGVLVGKYSITGSTSSGLKPGGLEEWQAQATMNMPGGEMQHFWNGSSFIGVKPALEVLSKPAGSVVLSGPVGGHPAQEIAVFEK